MMWGYSGFGYLWMVLMWASVIFLAVWIFGQSNRNEARAPRTAIDILEDRYARGEIDVDELKSRRRELIG